MYRTAVILLLLFSKSSLAGSLEGHVVGGIQAPIEKFPHSILLSINCGKSLCYCGGSILNQAIVLSAAHCFEDCKRKPGEWAVLKYGNAHSDLMALISMRNFVIHEKYNDFDMSNDIGLVSVKEPLRLGANVKRVSISPRPLVNIKLGFVAGWGVMNHQQQLSKVLLSTVQRLQDPDRCRLVGKLPPGTFCAGSVAGTNYPDEGDSGSALIAFNHVQIGVVSYKVRRYSLVVYSNVSHHYDWITSRAKMLYCKGRR